MADEGASEKLEARKRMTDAMLGLMGGFTGCVHRAIGADFTLTMTGGGESVPVRVDLCTRCRCLFVDFDRNNKEPDEGQGASNE